MMEHGREARIAHVQDQALRALRQPRRDSRRSAVRRGGARCKRFGRRRDLGGGVIKQCIARRGQGRASGFRTILVFRRGDRAFFVYGFAKSAQANLRRNELEAFRLLADESLTQDRSGLAAALAVGAIIEVRCDDQAVQE